MSQEEPAKSGSFDIKLSSFLHQAPAHWAK